MYQKIYFYENKALLEGETINKPKDPHIARTETKTALHILGKSLFQE